MRLIALALAGPSIAVLVIACAAEPVAATEEASAAQRSAAGDGDKVCTREYPTGSNIPVTKCRSHAQVEAEKRAATEDLRRAQTGGPNAKMGTN